jgi:GAF domain-containing protein
MSEQSRLQLQAALAELALEVFTSRTLSDNLERLVGVSCRLIPTCSAGSIAILVDGQPTTTAVSDHLAFELDLVQYDAGEGPCLTALGGQTVRFAVLDESERFPHFAIGAADRRIRSVLSTPIRHDDDIIGTLNLYSRQPDAFDEQAQRVADVTAAEAGTAIVTSRIYDQARQRRDELQAIHDEEAQISQAQGALMAVQRCSAEQALGLLANAADATGDDLIAVARRILDEVRRQPIDDAQHRSNSKPTHQSHRDT